MTDRPHNAAPDRRSGTTICPACGFHAPRRVVKCPLCGWGADEAESTPFADSGRATQFPQSEPALGRTFSLSTLMMFMTLLCVCLGVIMAAPGLGIPLAVLSVPAFIRASAAAASELSLGGRPDINAKISFFFSSLGVVLLATVAGGIAFLAACFVSCGMSVVTDVPIGMRWPGPFLRIGTAVAGILGVAAMIFFLWDSWPTRRNRE